MVIGSQHCDTAFFFCHKSPGQIRPMKTPIELAAEHIAAHNVELRALLLRFLDPDDLGYSVTEEVRSLISTSLNRPRNQERGFE